MCWCNACFEKGDPTKGKNYRRPVSVLPGASKFFKRVMHKQICFYIDQLLSPYMCGYIKGFSTKHALSSLIEKWRKVLDNKGYGGAILMGLSKVFVIVIEIP